MIDLEEEEQPPSLRDRIRELLRGATKPVSKKALARSWGINRHTDGGAFNRAWWQATEDLRRETGVVWAPSNAGPGYYEPATSSRVGKRGASFSRAALRKLARAGELLVSAASAAANPDVARQRAAEHYADRLASFVELSRPRYK